MKVLRLFNLPGKRHRDRLTKGWRWKKEDFSAGITTTLRSPVLVELKPWWFWWRVGSVTVSGECQDESEALKRLRASIQRARLKHHHVARTLASVTGVTRAG